MKNFFTTLLASFTNPHSYKRWLVLPQKNIIKFFTINMLLIGLINGSIFSIKYLPGWIETYKNSQHEFLNKYPEDLIINWENEKLSLSPVENYQNFDFNLKNLAGDNDLEDSYIYYRQEQLPDEEIKTILEPEQAIFLISDQKIYFKTEENEVFNKPINELIKSEDFIITKNDLPYVEEAINQQLVKWQPRLQLIVPVLAALFNLSTTMFASVIFTTFLWLMLKFAPLTIKRWNFDWRLSLAVLVTVSYLELLIQLIYPNTFTNIRELAFWLITGYVLLTWKLPRFKIQAN